MRTPQGEQFREMTHSPKRREPLFVVVMGVCGCGKSVIGAALARSLRVPFIEGDALHPAENVARMASGQPLTDADRAGWLEAIGAAITMEQRGAVAACSALKRIYRDRLRSLVPSLVFLHPDIDPETARRRVDGRKGHFMPATLVDSQFADLEPLQPDEAGMTLDGRRSIEDIVAASGSFFNEPQRGRL